MNFSQRMKQVKDEWINEMTAKYTNIMEHRRKA